MTYQEAKDKSHVRSSIYRKSKKILYPINHVVPLDERVRAEDQIADDWEEHDPRDGDESSLFMYND